MKRILIHLFLGLVALIPASISVHAADLQRVAVFSAFEPELKAVKAEMLPAGTTVKTTSINGTRFDEADIHGHHFVFALSGQSMVNAAMNTQLVIDRFHVNAVVFCGIAGGVNPQLHAGDVIVPAEWIHQMESIWANPDPARPGEHILPTWWKPKYGNFYEIYPNDVEVVREGVEAPQSMHAFPSDPDLLAAAKLAAAELKLDGPNGGKAQIIVGGAGMSGPVFLDNAQFRDFAFKTWQVNGHDMESTAVAQVGWVNHVSILVIRGLCDLAGGQTGSNEERLYFEVASKNAAIVTAHALLDLK